MMRSLLATLWASGVAVSLASAEETAMLQSIPPMDVEYHGHAVGSIASVQMHVPWKSEMFWATDEGVYRRGPEGQLRWYDLKELVGQVMGHALELSERGDVSRKIWNLVVQGETCWIASEAFGVLRWRPSGDQWTRYDMSAQAVSGRHLWVAYADPAYVMVIASAAGGVPPLSVFSSRRQRWATLRTVPAQYARSVGATPQEPWIVQPVDYRPALHDGVFEFPPAFSAIISADGTAYVYRDDTTQPRTRVELPGDVIEELFSWRR